MVKILFTKQGTGYTIITAPRSIPQPRIAMPITRQWSRTQTITSVYPLPMRHLSGGIK